MSKCVKFCLSKETNDILKLISFLGCGATFLAIFSIIKYIDIGGPIATVLIFIGIYIGIISLAIIEVLKEIATFLANNNLNKDNE